MPPVKYLAALIGYVGLVGVSRMENYPENLHRLHEASLGLPGGAPLEASLVPEPENPHDPDAVFVVAGGMKVGYLPRGTLYPYLLREGVRLRGRIRVLIHEDHPELPGVLLGCERVLDRV